MSSPLEALLGARIRRVDVPEPDLLSLTLSADALPGVALLVSTDPAHPALACVPDRPRGRPAEGIAKQLRNLLDGARIERVIDAGGGAVAFDLRRGSEAIGLVHEAAGDGSNAIVLDSEGRAIAALHPGRLAARGLRLGEPWSPPPHERIRDLPSDLEELLSAGAAFLDARRDARSRARRVALERALRRAQKKMERRAAATLADLDRAGDAPSLRDRGSAILAHLHAIPRDATEIDLPDWSTDPPGTLRIEIDPELGPRDTAEALFSRARKLEAGATIAATRHDEAITIATAIDALRERLALADDDALDALELEAKKLGAAPDARSPRGRRREPETRTPYRRYVGHGDRPILVGKAASDNDALTFQIARPQDLWMHVRGTGGSHVIVPLEKTEDCPSELLVDAALLAAHFSSARGERQVEIAYTRRKHLRKPKGGAPGQVIVANERGFLLRIDDDRLARLLRGPTEA